MPPRRQALATLAPLAAVAILIAAAALNRTATAPPRRAGSIAERERSAILATARDALGRCPRRLPDRPTIAVLDTAPDEDHGAAIASIIRRHAPDATIEPLPALDPTGRAGIAAITSSLDEAVRRGADIINISSWLPDHPAIDAALRRADAHSVIVVVAAGNDSRNLDRSPTWRQRSRLSCTLVVGASAADGTRLPGTNHGSTVVEVRAPGQQISAQDPDGQPTAIDGTSPAAAIVTSLLAAH